MDEQFWYKMSFEVFHCFASIEIVNSHWAENKDRMEDLEVFVVNTDTNKEKLCGIVATFANVQGQTYTIPCKLNLCGNEVKLTLILAISISRQL